VLKLRKGEARGNPIEQLQNFMRQKAQQVADFRAAVMTINGQIKNLQSMVEQRKKERPGYDATAQEKSIAAMTDAYNALRQKYKNAENALAELQVVIQDKEFEWKFSQAGQQAMQTLNATSGQELMEAMLADEAFSSVTDNFNKVFAELEMEAENLSAAKSLDFSPGMTIDVSAINLSNKVTV
jgi:chromosome segregation ATPase